MKRSGKSNIEIFNKRHNIVKPFNVVPPEDNRVEESSLLKNGVDQYKKTQTQYRRNKVFHKFSRNTTETESISGSTTRNREMTFDTQEGNENKLLEIYDNGWKIRKTTLYLIQAQIPCDLNDIYYIQTWLEKTSIGGSAEDIAYRGTEGANSSTDLADYMEEITISLTFVGMLYKGDIVKLKSEARTNSSSGYVRIGNQLGTLSLVSLSY